MSEDLGNPPGVLSHSSKGNIRGLDFGSLPFKQRRRRKPVFMDVTQAKQNTPAKQSINTLHPF